MDIAIDRSSRAARAKFYKSLFFRRCHSGFVPGNKYASGFVPVFVILSGFVPGVAPPGPRNKWPTQRRRPMINY